MSQILDTGRRPPLQRRILARTAVTAACLPARRGAEPASYDQALAARHDVTATSTLCSGRYCLQRALATAPLCWLRGVWPTWCTGVRTPPFAAHAWVEAEGRPVGEPQDTTTYHPMITVTPRNKSSATD
ncbi:lasso peptide biosynthesis B2 protein [Streptomyces beigongshangae]|uniref:lasso peptide biosynthesis B2 protein n=1 Tax=Streptomyces beigongshangae TaxID=2841597 RepID=UPI001C84206B|nr:lasso peptide biosynthesis B2 protein [Streptomyces sp. REN17]